MAVKMAIKDTIKELTKLIYSVAGCNGMYVYRCSKNLMGHAPAMKVLNQTFSCKSIYSGTYDNEFIISCRHEIYGKVPDHSGSTTSAPAAASAPVPLLSQVISLSIAHSLKET